VPKPRPTQLSPDDAAELRKLYSAFRSLLERSSQDGENTKALYERFVSFDRRVKKVLDELSERIERIERLLLLERTGNSQAAEAREIRSEIKQELTSLQWQMSRRIKNLNILQEQAVNYGNRVPLDLINAITDEQDEIQELQVKIDEHKDREKRLNDR
jgi:hypothetical protein